MSARASSGGERDDTLNRKQKRNKALRRSVPDLAGVHPKIAEGLTYGKHAIEEANERFDNPDIVTPDGADMVRHMHDADKRMTRSGFAPFVASNSTASVWSDGVTDRVQMDYQVAYTEEGFRLLREGRQCLRCQEPHPDDPFPDMCDICGYTMKERQIMDIAMEFDGLKHIGPQKGISEYLEEQEERVERERFRQRQLNGGRSVRMTKKIYSPEAKKLKFGAKGPKPQIILPKGVSAS